MPIYGSAPYEEDYDEDPEPHEATIFVSMLDGDLKVHDVRQIGMEYVFDDHWDIERPADLGTGIYAVENVQFVALEGYEGEEVHDHGDGYLERVWMDLREYKLRGTWRPATEDEKRELSS